MSREETNSDTKVAQNLCKGTTFEKPAYVE